MPGVTGDMARFYLNIRNGTGFVEDPEGQDCADLELARNQAIDGVRSFLSEELRNGELDLTGTIEIADETGAVLMVVPFRDAVALRIDGCGA